MTEGWSPGRRTVRLLRASRGTWAIIHGAARVNPRVSRASQEAGSQAARQPEREGLREDRPRVHSEPTPRPGRSCGATGRREQTCRRRRDPLVPELADDDPWWRRGRCDDAGFGHASLALNDSMDQGLVDSKGRIGVASEDVACHVL